MAQLIVWLERKDKRVAIVLNDADYDQSVVMVKGERKMYWGTGARWTVLSAMDQAEYEAGPNN